MGKYQRTKGASGEREVVNLLKAAGQQAKRISMLETNHIDKGDVLIDNKYIGSVKIGKQVPKFFYDGLGDAHMLFARRDREKWLVTLPLDVLLNLLEK
jgi:hypothetical protein